MRWVLKRDRLLEQLLYVIKFVTLTQNNSPRCFLTDQDDWSKNKNWSILLLYSYQKNLEIEKKKISKLLAKLKIRNKLKEVNNFHVKYFLQSSKVNGISKCFSSGKKKSWL